MKTSFLANLRGSVATSNISVKTSDPAFVKVARLVRSARRLLVLSGAGISAESGIPTFRSGVGGLWGRHDPKTLATREGFEADPEGVWAWYAWRRAQIRLAQPHAGHVALAEYARKVPHLDVVTQNIDDLHERAGSPRVVHLHGQIALARCLQCATPYPLPEQEVSIQEGDRLAPPRCAACAGLIRPDVVWFGEALSHAIYAATIDLCEQCDVALVVGTSGLVQPAASLPELARRRGALVVQVNPEPTELDDSCHFNLIGPASAVLPPLLLREDYSSV